jgi:class 3 adenylate cyclase
MEDDFERYDIDRSDPSAEDRAGVGRYLEEAGVPLADIAATRSLDEISALAWAHIFGISGRRISVCHGDGGTGTRVARLMRALGFSDADVEVGFPESEQDVLQFLSDAETMFGEEQVLHLARVIGSATARIAESLAASMRVNFESPIRDSTSYAEFVRVAAPLVSDGLDRLSHGIDRILRYHLLAVSSRGAYAVEGSATTVATTVGFADMVGFTARSGTSSTTEIVGVIDDFEGRVTDAVTGRGGRIVKFIGDEVLFVFDEPAKACECALALLDLVADESIPDVRVGMAYGDVVTRYGDYYGPVVNLASRIVGVAPSNDVLVDGRLARSASDFEFDRLAPQRVKGIAHEVELFSLRARA